MPFAKLLDLSHRVLGTASSPARVKSKHGLLATGRRDTDGSRKIRAEALPQIELKKPLVRGAHWVSQLCTPTVIPTACYLVTGM